MSYPGVCTNKNKLITALAIGGLKGLVAGTGLYFAIGMAYPGFRKIRIPVKIAWFVCWMGLGAFFAGDKKVLMYSSKYKMEKELRDQEFLERAADNGEYIDNI